MLIDIKIIMRVFIKNHIPNIHKKEKITITIGADVSVVRIL